MNVPAPNRTSTRALTCSGGISCSLEASAPRAKPSFRSAATALQSMLPLLVPYENSSCLRRLACGGYDATGAGDQQLVNAGGEFFLCFGKVDMELSASRHAPR